MDTKRPRVSPSGVQPDVESKFHLPWGLTRPSRVVCVQGKSMDARLISEEPELVMAHLNARKASDEQRASVTEIAGQLTQEESIPVGPDDTADGLQIITVVT